MSAPGVEALRVEGVSRRFGGEASLAARLGLVRARRAVHALDGVDLVIPAGAFVGLVGESGSGKSTLGRIAAGLLAPSEGRALVFGRDATRDPAVHRDVQMVFQDPQASLNPRMRIGRAIAEAPLHHGVVGPAEADAYVSRQLARAGLDPTPGLRARYPHEFSGGQRQRVSIARALAMEPKFLVCDESVASLDVSIQAQILNLFMALREELALTYLFISHDLRVVRHVCDRVVVMYLGRIVEDAPSAEFFAGPNHPYAQALVAEIADLKTRRRVYAPMKGEIPSPAAPPAGCHFHPRCPYAFARCRRERPVLAPIAPGRFSACHLNDPPS